jgi:transposase-like protein
VNDLPKGFDGDILPGMSSRRFTKKEREHWLAQFDQSSLSAAAFCREHQLGYQGFLNWRRKARPADKKATAEFIEVEVPKPSPTPIHRGSMVELVFPDGLLLRIHPQSSAHS